VTGPPGAASRWLHTGPLQVLLIEDNPGDVRLTREALADANALLSLHVTTDGIDGLAFLRHRGAHADAPRPHLILLDLNLPKMDGRELLALIKEDAELKTIPVVVLTASDADEDINRCHELKANCYLCKPLQLQTFWDLVQSVNTFWLGFARLPAQEPDG
jgi:two-component system, chemotaxis family, response regulator Rcp1